MRAKRPREATREADLREPREAKRGERGRERLRVRAILSASLASPKKSYDLSKPIRLLKRGPERPREAVKFNKFLTFDSISTSDDESDVLKMQTIRKNPIHILTSTSHNNIQYSTKIIRK